jgi:uncharacterized membrane protein HdeD (DUF308 family)
MKLNWKVIVSFWGALLMLNGVFMFIAIIPGVLMHNDFGWKALLISGVINIFIGGLM